MNIRKPSGKRQRGQTDYSQATRWGPVAGQPLLGQPVAIHWAALDADAINFNLFDLEQAETLQQAINIVNSSRRPAAEHVAG